MCQVSKPNYQSQKKSTATHLYSVSCDFEQTCKNSFKSTEQGVDCCMGRDLSTTCVHRVQIHGLHVHSRLCQYEYSPCVCAAQKNRCGRQQSNEEFPTYPFKYKEYVEKLIHTLMLSSYTCIVLHGSLYNL